MEEGKSPEEILDEIMNRTPAPESTPSPFPPRFGPPPPEDNPPPPPDAPGKKDHPDMAAKLLPWLCIMLGAALLVMGACVLQVVKMNHRLEALEETVEGIAYIDQLQRENKILQREKEDLEKELTQADRRKRELEREKQTYMDDRDRIVQRLNITAIQKWRSDYLFYIGRFMENKDYPMAAMVVVLSANRYLSTASSLADVPYNPAQQEQYETYCRELLDRGYLQEPSSGYLTWGGANYEMAEKYDPSQNPDMAALGILWCALDGYYVTDSYGPPEQYLITYQYLPLGSDAIPYPQRLRNTASDEILQLYEQLINDLAARGGMVITDGALDYNPDLSYNSVLYSLPFDPPVDYASIPAG